MEDDCKENCIQLLFESEILIEEDASFLESVLTISSERIHHRKYGIHSHLYHRLRNCGFTFGTAFCYVAARSLLPISRPVDRAVVSLLSAGAIAMVISCGESLRTKLLFDRGTRDVGSFVRRCSQFLRFVKRCLSFVQEMEVIGRGFLLTLSGASLSSLRHSHLFPGLSPLSKSCSCVRLRHLLFSTIRVMIRLFALDTKELVMKCPLNDNFDHKSHYVAFIEDYEFGRLMTVSLENEDELLVATDNLSLSALKLSEFVRRLTLCFSKVQPKREEQNLEDLFVITSNVLDGLGRSLDDATEELRRSYDFHQLIGRAEDSIESINCRTNKNSKLDFSLEASLTTAVRSLTLHLQVASSKAHDLSLLLESHLKSCEGESESKEIRLSSLSDELEAISHDLRCCQGCYDESVLRLTKLRNVGKPTEVMDLVSAKETEQDAVSTLTVPLIGKTDLAHEDQVFVAYISNDRSVLCSNDHDDSEIESQIRSKEQKEVSQRMFAELKKVLIPKSEEWQMREAKALAKNPHAIAEDLETSSTLERHELPLNGRKTDGSTVEIETGPSVDRAILDEECNGTMNIASMAAARSKLWNLNSGTDTFQAAGEEYFDSDSDSV